MTTKRDELLQQIRSGSEQSRQAGLDAWNAHADRIRTAVDDEDRYWLEDRLQDEECELGYAPHPSHISHLLASRGLAYLGDQNPSAGPHPHFTLFSASFIDAESVRPERGNGGWGASTWGFMMPTSTAWFAHSVPAAESVAILEGKSRMRDELAALGIELGDPPA